jgi:hypothetical protein
MNIIKLITIFNWVVIGVLAYLVAAETLFPAKGGDAAGRGMGQFIYVVAIVALILMGILNFLPYNWAKYTAFGVVVVPFLFTIIEPLYQKMKRRASFMIEDAKPIFEDKERDQIARAVHEGQPDKLKKLLETPVARLNDNKGELLGYAVGEATSSAYRPSEKIECVRILLENGASLDSANTLEEPIHLSAAFAGNAKLLRLLLEHGAKANARQYYTTNYIIFEAIAGYQEPEASVRALLEFGADVTVTALFDDEKGKVTPLYRAAQTGRWSVCVALLEKGADPDFVAKDGTSFRTYLEEANSGGFYPDGYSTKEDFERVKALAK